MIENPGLKALIEAVCRHDVHQARNLLAQGVDPNAVEDWAGITPLHYAVVYQCHAIASLLLKAGARLQPNVDGDTPDRLAVELEDDLMIALLKNHAGESITIQ